MTLIYPDRSENYLDSLRVIFLGAACWEAVRLAEILIGKDQKNTT
jgi:hypothetical protein